MKEILILDIETTGFLNKGGKIVEIGIVSLNLETGLKRILLDQMVHENGITQKECEDSWIINNSDMTVQDIKGSVRLDRLTPTIQVIINAFPDGATAFNNVFDFGFMEDRGFVFPKKLDCPMRLLTPIMKLKNNFRKNSYKWPNVQEAYDWLFPLNDYSEKHRGANDAFHEADIVLEMYKQGYFKID